MAESDINKTESGEHHAAEHAETIAHGGSPDHSHGHPVEHVEATHEKDQHVEHDRQ